MNNFFMVLVICHLISHVGTDCDCILPSVRLPFAFCGSGSGEVHGILPVSPRATVSELSSWSEWDNAKVVIMRVE